MKKKNWLILFSLPLLLAWAPNSDVDFARGMSWEQAEQRAKTEEKLFFVDFDASYCATCHEMDKTTYSNRELARYMAENVVALKMNVQEFDGVAWSQQYEVEALPTMLIFNEKGKLVKRLVGYQSAADLRKQFESARVTSVPNTPTGGYKPVTSSTPKSTSTKSTTSTSRQPLDVATSTGMAYEKIDEDAIYEIEARRVQVNGFTIQSGVYSSYDLALEQIEHLRGAFKEKVFMQRAVLKGKLVYKLYLGRFDKRRDAMKLLRTMRRKKLGGIVKRLS